MIKIAGRLLDDLAKTKLGGRFLSKGGRELIKSSVPGAAITTALSTLTTGNPLAGAAIGATDLLLSTGAARALARNPKLAGKFLTLIDDAGKEVTRYEPSMAQNIAMLAGSVAAPAVLEPMLSQPRYNESDLVAALQAEAQDQELTQEQQMAQMAVINRLQQMQTSPGTLFQTQGLPQVSAGLDPYGLSRGAI
jgi:hypothetical protein